YRSSRLSAGLDRDLSFGLFRLGALRQAQPKHALVVACLDLVLLNLEGQGYGTVEGPVGSLGDVVVLLFFLLLRSLLALDRQHAVGERAIDVLLVDAGQLNGDVEPV